MKTYKSPIIETVVWEAGTLCQDQIFSTSGANGGQQIPGGGTQAPGRKVF